MRIQLPAELTRFGVGALDLTAQENDSCLAPWIVAIAMDEQLIESYTTNMVDIYDYAFTEATLSIAAELFSNLEADLNDPQVLQELQNDFRAELFDTFFAEPAGNVNLAELTSLSSLAAATLVGATSGTLLFPELPAGRRYFVTAEIWASDPGQDCRPARYSAAATALVEAGTTTPVTLQPRSTRADLYSALINEYGVPVFARHPAAGDMNWFGGMQNEEPSSAAWVVREFRQELPPDAAGNRVFRHHLFVLDATATYDPTSQFVENGPGATPGSGRVAPSSGAFAELSLDTEQFLFDDWSQIPEGSLSLNAFQAAGPPSVTLARASFDAGAVVIDAKEADSENPYFEVILSSAGSAGLFFDFDGAADLQEESITYAFGTICFEDRRGLLTTSCEPDSELIQPSPE